MRRKTLTVLSKRDFNKISKESLFKQGGTVTENKELPYCAGKYKKEIIGKEIKVPEYIKAVFAIAKSDSHGTYYQLRFAD